MKLSSFLKAWSAIVPGRKTRRRLKKRLAGPKASSPSKPTRPSPPQPPNDETEHLKTPQQPKLCEHCQRELVLAASTLPSAAPRLDPIAPPQREEHCSPRLNPQNRALPPTPPLCASQTPAAPEHLQEEYGALETGGSTSLFTSEGMSQIVASSPSLLMHKDETSEPRFAHTTEGRLKNATEVDMGATASPSSAEIMGLHHSSSISLVDSSTHGLPASPISNKTVEGHSVQLCDSVDPSDAPVMPSPTKEDKNVLVQYRAEADDDQSHAVFPMTLPHRGAHNPAPLGLAVDEEERQSHGQTTGIMQIPWDYLLVSVPYPSFKKRKRSSSSKRPLLHAYTQLTAILEEPLLLSTSGTLSDDDTLIFKFRAIEDEDQPRTVDEAFNDFENFLNQHLDTLELDLKLAAGVPFPSNFLALAIARAQTRLARFTNVTLRFEGAAAQAQGTWLWPPDSQLQFLRLDGIARGGILPWTQLQGLFLCAELKATEAASLLTSLPQLRVLSLCLGRTGSGKSFRGPSVLPRLERLDLHVRVDPAAFLARVHLPALRILNLYVSGYRIEWGDD